MFWTSFLINFLMHLPFLNSCIYFCLFIILHCPYLCMLLILNLYFQSCERHSCLFLVMLLNFFLIPVFIILRYSLILFIIHLPYFISDNYQFLFLIFIFIFHIVLIVGSQCYIFKVGDVILDFFVLYDNRYTDHFKEIRNVCSRRGSSRLWCQGDQGGEFM